MATIEEDLCVLIQKTVESGSIELLNGQDIGSYVQKLMNYAEVVTWSASGQIRAVLAFYCNDPRRETAFITIVAVDPSYRRMKLASALLGGVLSSLRSRAFSRCLLEVQTANLGAIALYRKFGFHDFVVKETRLTMEVTL